mgnify:CR=1 FL=1|tara:strand:+ start:8235 stop:10562 length:2328 start_codon:yes stop_codon:yes gene_type:complete
MDLKNFVNDLTITDKICLYNTLYEELACKGIDGDTELAHVNQQEMAVLRAMGGSGTINPNTNLVQFGGGGSPPPPPPAASSTVTQQATIPDELKPFVTDILEKGQAIQERREDEGYVPFDGPRIAGFAEEQEEAFTGLQGQVGAGQPFFDIATGLTASSAQAPTAESVSQFSNPFIQNVIGIQQREAERLGDVERQRIGAQAVQAGGFGGSRHAILEAEQSRNLQQRLGDIQSRGSAAAFEDAQARLQQQRDRERQAGAQFTGLGAQVPAQRIRELTGLEAVGAQRQAQSQRGLDIAQDEYEIARTFPERSLQDYNAIVRGYSAPIPASTLQRTQTSTPAPSFLQQAAGIGGLALGAGKAFGGLNQGGLVALAEGGKPEKPSLLEKQEEEITEKANRESLSQGQEFINEDSPSFEEEFSQVQNLGRQIGRSIVASPAEYSTKPGQSTPGGAKGQNFNVGGNFGFKKGGLVTLAPGEMVSEAEEVEVKEEEYSPAIMDMIVKPSKSLYKKAGQYVDKAGAQIDVMGENFGGTRKGLEEARKNLEEKKNILGQGTITPDQKQKQTITKGKGGQEELVKNLMASLNSNNNLSGISDVMASQKEVNKEQAKLSAEKRRILAAQNKDMEFGALDFAAGLLKFAAADPEKHTTQQLAIAFGDMPEKMQNDAKEKRANELAVAGLDVADARLKADGEMKMLTLNIALKKARASGAINAGDAAKIIEAVGQNPAAAVAMAKSKQFPANVSAAILAAEGSSPQAPPRIPPKGDVVKATSMKERQ